MTNSQVILYSSEEAATKRTVTGWVSRHGRFYGEDEHLARWDGSTHQVCACGKEMVRSRLKCEACCDADDKQRWESLPLVEWDGGPFCLDDGDKYFDSESDFFEWCEDNDYDPDSIRLVRAEPVYLRTVDGDYWSDDLAEDGELPDEIASALKALNDAIKKRDRPVSYRPSRKRIVMAKDSQ